MHLLVFSNVDPSPNEVSFLVPSKHVVHTQLVAEAHALHLLTLQASHL